MAGHCAELYGANGLAEQDFRVRAPSGIRLARPGGHRDAAYLARSLTRIVCDVPMQARHADLQRRTPDLARIAEFCDAQGFGLLLRRQAERLGLAALGDRL